jgi:ATP-dependent protease HslVU (ClpYQ) peptidase subunit
MTVIVGVEDDHGCAIGSDTYMTSGWQKRSTSEGKFALKPPYIIGGAGNVSDLQLINYRWDPPIPDVDQATDVNYLERFLVENTIPSLRQLFIDAGKMGKDDGVDNLGGDGDEGSTFMIAVGGRLFLLHSGMAIVRPMHGLLTAGSGADVAIGAMKVYRDHVGVQSMNIAQEGIDAAIMYAHGCDGQAVLRYQLRPGQHEAKVYGGTISIRPKAPQVS